MKTEKQPKQEILEEAAEKYSENWEEITGLDYENVVPSEVNKLDFINGAKWQQEQNKKLYSEEDLKEAFIEGALTDLFNTWDISDKDMAKEKFVGWFEQFKKK